MFPECGLLILAQLWGLWTLCATAPSVTTQDSGTTDELSSTKLYLDNQDLLSKHLSNYEIVYPIQIRKNQKLDLSTRDHKARHRHAHFHHTTIQMMLHGRKVKIPLRLNQELLESGLKRKYSVDQDNQMITEGPVEHCYYQGKIRRERDSFVAVSTCSGISGVINTENKTYIIQPLRGLVPFGNETRWPHVVYEASMSPPKYCANPGRHWRPFEELHRGEFLRRLKIAKSKVHKDAGSDTKFIELALVYDHSMYLALNASFSAAVHRSLQVANILDIFFKQLNTRVTLVYIEVWNVQDLVHVSSNVRETLHNFMQYRHRRITSVTPDSVQFVTLRSFNHHKAGMAMPDTVCSGRAIGVNQDPNIEEPQQLASVLAHMIGQNLGMRHDREGCNCADPNGCVMSAKVTGHSRYYRPVFSSCSQKDLNMALKAGLGSCLYKNRPYEPSYNQVCGNGILERGEECDCEPTDCAYKDPCCDPSTCLLRHWATCRSGPCCYNCTILSSNHVCRQPVSECDVPEFCDGKTGECAKDLTVQTGVPCGPAIDGYCYNGQCHTYTQQCEALWGKGSKAGDHRWCYEKFNPTGNFNGHCGKNAKTGKFIKCSVKNVHCGLLQCAGGQDKPLLGKHKRTFFSTTNTVSDGVEYQCKIINDEAATKDAERRGMVKEGTKCDTGHICARKACVSLATLVKQQCVRGANGQICSGNGVCTNEATCFCTRSHMGPDCSVRVNITTTIATPPTTTATAVVKPRVISRVTEPVTRRRQPTTTTAARVVAKAENNISTLWLVIVLATGVGAAVVIMGFCFLCYRRRSPARLKDSYKKKALLHEKLMMLPSGKKTKSDDGSVDMGSRIISFGNMPSYREDKIKKMQRQQGMSTISQSESEHSHGDRESTEVKVLPQNLTLPLAKPPEKGILKKKYPRSADDIAALAQGRGSQVVDEEEEEEEEPEEEEVEDGEEEDEKESISEQSDYTDDDDDDDDEKKEFTPTPSDEEKSLGDDDNTEDKGEGSPRHSGSSSPTPKPPPRQPSKDSIAETRNRIRRLKNIDELIRQIDEHMSQLSASPDPTERNLSPANSDELPGSETEVDRHYPRDSFYHLSDVDDSVSAGQPSSIRSGSSLTQPRSPSTLPQSSPSLPHAPSPSIPQSSPSPLSPLAPHLQLPLLAHWPSSRQSNSPGDLQSLAKKTPSRGSDGSQSPARNSDGSRSPAKGSPSGGTPERHCSPRRSQFRHGSPTKSDKSDGQFSPIKKPPSPIKEPPRYQSAPMRQPYSHVRQCSPARQPNSVKNGHPTTGMENPNSVKIGKIPDIPTSPSRARRANNTDPGHDRASSGKVPPEPPPRNPQLHKLINPLLDSYLARRSSLTTDGQSNSEGYHSDRTGDDETVIIREIPVVKQGDAQYLSPKQNRYTKTTPTAEGEETVPV